MKNENIIHATAALTTERNLIAAELLTLDAEYRNRHAELAAMLLPLDKAIGFLTGKATVSTATPTGRKPMSAEARENIRLGLERSRAAKAAATKPEPKPTAKKAAKEVTVVANA